MISIIQEKLSVSNPFSLKFINYNKFNSKISVVLEDNMIETYRMASESKIKANVLSNYSNQGTVYNRIVVDTVDILSTQEYDSTNFYLFKSATEDSTILIFPLKQNNLKEKIDESNNLYKFLDEIQKVSSLLLYY
jgi:hypothetical protein